MASVGLSHVGQWTERVVGSWCLVAARVFQGCVDFVARVGLSVLVVMSGRVLLLSSIS